MEQLLNELRVSYMDGEINALLASLDSDENDTRLKIGYSQNEELFFDLDSEIFVPRFNIHHDVRLSEPSASYASALKNLVSQLSSIVPCALSGLTYYFDPAEILKPCFFRLYKVEDSIYLYHLRLDLSRRPFEGEVLESGTNDATAAYRGKRIYAESEIIPLDAAMWELGRVKAFKIKQLISNTWIGETGRGYLLRGVWMDSDLSKFFTKLFLPEGVRIYPFYPFFCKYKTLCASCPHPGPDYRKRFLPFLHRAIGFLAPEIDKIQAALKAGSFSEKMAEFVELREKMPPLWRDTLRGFSSSAYLNNRDLKEYRLALPD